MRLSSRTSPRMPGASVVTGDYSRRHRRPKAALLTASEFVAESTHEIAAGLRRLAIAMIRQTAHDLAGVTNRLDARAWLMRDDDEQPGFVWCCQALGLRHTVIREAIIERPEWIAARLSRLVEASHKTVAA